MGQFEEAIVSYDGARALLTHENPTLEGSRNFAFVAAYLSDRHKGLPTICG